MDDGWVEKVFFSCSFSVGRTQTSQQWKHIQKISTEYLLLLLSVHISSKNTQRKWNKNVPSTIRHIVQGGRPLIRKCPGNTTSQLCLCRLTVCQINHILWPAELVFNWDSLDYLNMRSRTSIFQGIKCFCAILAERWLNQWGTPRSHCRKRCDGLTKNNNGGSSSGINGQKLVPTEK